MRIEMMIDK